MPSIAAMPNSATKPIAADTLNGVPVSTQREDAADQRHRNHAGGQQRVAQTEPKFRYSSRHDQRDRQRHDDRQAAPIASCRLPNSPTHSRR